MRYAQRAGAHQEDGRSRHSEEVHRGDKEDRGKTAAASRFGHVDDGEIGTGSKKLELPSARAFTFPSTQFSSPVDNLLILIKDSGPETLDFGLQAANSDDSRKPELSVTAPRQNMLYDSKEHHGVRGRAQPAEDNDRSTKELHRGHPATVTPASNHVLNESDLELGTHSTAVKERLMLIFKNKIRYSKLLKSSGQNAQSLLDLFQAVSRM